VSHPIISIFRSALDEKRWPTRADLDKVSPNNPVYIPTPLAWPHPAVLNSVALDLLGLTRDTSREPPNEPMVIIEKDASGEPTGLINGFSVYNRSSPLYRKLLAMLPRTPPDLQQEGVRRALAESLPAGLTTLYEGHYAFWLPVFRTLKENGKLPVRVVSTYDVPADRSLAEIDAWMKERTDAMGRGSGDDWLKVVGVTISMDGASQFGAALMKKPYLDPYGRRGNGTSAVSTEKLTEVARLAAKNNLRANFVVGGNLASEQLVEALEAVNREVPLANRQWVAAHVQHATHDQIARFKQMGIMVTTYSAVDFSKGAETYVKCFDDPEIWQTSVPLRWWLDAGVEIAQSTDSAHFEPLFTLWESLRRIDGRTGKSLLTPAKTITRKEAIQMYTIYAARVLQWDDRLGSIEAGKLADFVVIDRDPLTVPVDEIRTARVLKTVISGRIVHDSKLN
jgi:predicted amidohydrolase YtcJ